MKRKSFTPRWIIVGLILIVMLSACERQVKQDETPEGPDVVEPTSAPIVIPTAVPTEVPAADAPEVPAVEQPAETGTGTETPAEETPAEETPTEAPPAETPVEAKSHTVQAGDTLSRIAEFYGVSMEEIAAANNLPNVHSLDVGQVLTIPAPGAVEAPQPTGEESTHTVRAGENLFRIGLAYGFTAEELASYNGITNPARIEVGQVIKIPPSQ